MPIYPYECENCSNLFDRITSKVSTLSWKEESKLRIKCPECGKKTAKKIVGQFKIGDGLLDTTGKSGYLTDDLTVGKVVDEGGIPYEFKEKLKEREEMIERQVQYRKDLAKRAKKYDFDPAGNEEN